MDDQERKRYLDILRSTPARLKASTKGLPKAVWTWVPAPGKWSILEIACHLGDMEREAYLARYRSILAEETPALPDIDGDIYSLEYDYRSKKPNTALREWTRLRRECLKILGKVKRGEWERAGIHETAGRLTMADLLRRQALGNDEAHLGQIEAIKTRYEVIGKLASAPARLAEALRDFSPEALRRAPAEGKWSAIEIACHLRDIDRLYAEHVTKAAFSERPSFWMMDNARVVEKLRYREADVAALLKENRRRRSELTTLLRSLPDSVWQRTGIHPKRGEISIGKLAEVIADHDESHLSQIEVLPRS
jgi:uncharacterized damage-inducible protein DinB